MEEENSEKTGDGGQEGIFREREMDGEKGAVTEGQRWNHNPEYSFSWGVVCGEV